MNTLPPPSKTTPPHRQKKKTEEEEIQKKHKRIEKKEKGEKEESFYCFCGVSFGCELGQASHLIRVPLESCSEGSEEV